MARWRSILTGETQRKALAIAGELAEALRHAPMTRPFDEASVALGLLYADGAAVADGLAAAAADRLDAAVTGFSPTLASAPVGLWHGIPGMAWMLDHLADEPEALALFDRRILDALEVPHWDGDYELIRGLVGIGVYAVERRDEELPRRIACRVVDHLAAAASDEASGITWWTRPERIAREFAARAGTRLVNLGLAHGVPGVIALLAKLVAADVEAPRARRLLDGAVAWMRTVAPARDGGRFAAFHGPGLSTEPTRLAWCYGDPGVALAWMAAARATDDAALAAEALALARTASERELASTGVVDMGVCHGAAGLAHMFNRMAQHTGDEALADAARSWIERLIAMRRSGPIAGFPAWMPLDEAESRWHADAGLLTGATGVLLTLLAAATDEEPAWDRLLLMS